MHVAGPGGRVAVEVIVDHAGKAVAMVPGVGGRGRIACIEKAVGVAVDIAGRAVAFGVIAVGKHAVEEELVVFGPNGAQLASPG